MQESYFNIKLLQFQVIHGVCAQSFPYCLGMDVPLVLVKKMVIKGRIQN